MTAEALTSDDERSVAARSVEQLAQTLLQRASLPTEVHDVESLQGGRNNRVFRVQACDRAFLLKQYFRHAADPRDRLGAEWRFSRLLWDGGVRDVPQPLAMDVASGGALFEWIEGEALCQDDVTPAGVEGALQFAVAIQVLRNENASEIQPASEACFTFDDHVSLVQRRIEKVANVEMLSELHRQVKLWVSDELLPRWDDLLRRMAHELRTTATDPTDVLPTGHRCLSPSDFGFHNAMRRAAQPRSDLLNAERLAFFDFEYAGWDDPAKLVCDFFCQPRLPVPTAAFDRFAVTITQAIRGEVVPGDVIESETRRMRMLLPIYQFKWCCICLNEFLPGGSARRAHANEQHNSGTQLQTQFDSAKRILVDIKTEQM